MTHIEQLPYLARSGQQPAAKQRPHAQLASTHHTMGLYGEKEEVRHALSLSLSLSLSCPLPLSLSLTITLKLTLLAICPTHTQVPYLKLRSLVPPLRAAARGVNLSHSEEEVMECLFKLLTTPPKEPPKPPPSFADMASRPATTVQQPAVDVSEAQAEEEAPLQLAWGAKPAGNNKWADSDDDEDGELDLSSLKAVVPPKPQPEPKKEALTTAPAAATATTKAVGDDEEEVAPPDDWGPFPSSRHTRISLAHLYSCHGM